MVEIFWSVFIVLGIDHLFLNSLIVVVQLKAKQIVTLEYKLFGTIGEI